MNEITHEWLKIAADMIDAKKATIDGNSSDNEVHAASFLFDQGIFFMGPDGMSHVKEVLLEKYSSSEVTTP